LILTFLSLLPTHGLATHVFDTVSALLRTRGLIVRRWMAEDNTINSEPSAPANHTVTQDSKIHQMKKGSKCVFGMRPQIGIYTKTRLEYAELEPELKTDVVTQTHTLFLG